MSRSRTHARPAAPDFEGIRAALESLPLGTDEFALASAHLENARAYWAAGERGAAAYELRLFLGVLSRGGHLGGRHPGAALIWYSE